MVRERLRAHGMDRSRMVVTGRRWGTVHDSPIRFFQTCLNAWMIGASYRDVTVMCFPRKRTGRRQAKRERDPCLYRRI